MVTMVVSDTLPAATYSIGELAQEFDVTTRAMRFYEDQGLLHPRRNGRQRIYSRRDRTRLKLTLRGKRLGLSLSEIRELLDLFDTSKNEQLQLRHFIQVLDEHRSTLLNQKHDLEELLDEIETARADCLKRLDKKRTNNDLASPSDVGT